MTTKNIGRLKIHWNNWIRKHYSVSCLVEDLKTIYKSAYTLEKYGKCVFFFSFTSFESRKLRLNIVSKKPIDFEYIQYLLTFFVIQQNSKWIH